MKVAELEPRDNILEPRNNVFDATDYIRQQQRASVANVIDSIDAEPERAARAQDLSDDTGVPATLIYANQEHFEKQHKIATTNALLASNDYLRNYIDSHPMAAKISNGDLGALDKFSESLGKFSGSVGETKGQHGLGTIGVGKAAAQGFWQGLNPEEPLEKWFLDSPGVKEYMQNYPVTGPISAKLAGLVGLPITVPIHLFNATLEGLRAGGSEFLKQQGLDEQNARRVTDAFVGSLEHHLISGQAHITEISPEVVDKIQAKKVMQYITRGQEVPIGISPAYDTFKIMESEKDLKNFLEAQKDANATSTKELSPELTSDFARQHVGESTIAIDPVAIRKLYGDKEPTVDDGILGWIPGLKDRLPVAEQTGDFIEVPMAEWLAKHDPDIGEQLKDDIRVRPNGFSKQEIELHKEHEAAIKDAEVELGKPLSSGDITLDTVRAQGGLEPLFDEERVNKVTLEKVQEAEEPPPSWEVAATGHGTRFDIKDTTGNTVGQLQVFDKGKTLDIGWIGSHERATLARPNVWGPRVVRDLLAQLREQYPDAETITGRRVSGAREVPTEVSINLEAPDEAILRKLSEELDFLFTKKEGGTNVTRLPEELRTPAEKELIEKVSDLLDRIAPQAKVEPVQRMGKPGFITKGRHTFDPAIAESLIQWSIEGDHPIGTARHEAIHHLRTMGMFKPEEWIALEEAAQRGNWQERFRIDNRYPDQTPEVKVEESIAEAYREWGAGRLQVEGPIAQLFERIKELLKQIADLYREYTGKLPEGQRLFERIEKGEIGQREAFSGEMPERIKAAYGLAEQEPELPQAGTTRMEDRKPFEGKAIGISKKMNEKYLQLIEKSWQDDINANLKKYLKQENLRQSAEWKSDREAMRREVAKDLEERPDLAADELFRKGLFYGRRIKGAIPKLDPKNLTLEQRSGIPKEYQSAPGEGVYPDDLAGMFGYKSGYALAQALTGLEAMRKESGLKGKKFFDSIVDQLTDRRMEQKYGVLEENAMTDAKDRALSKTKLDMIHEEMIGLLGENKRAELTIQRADTDRALQTRFNSLPISVLKSDAFLRASKKASDEIEKALLNGDAETAYKAKQKQYAAVFMAKAALKLEKEKESFGKKAERFAGQREVSGVTPAYTDWVQDLLYRTGHELDRTYEDLKKEINAREQATLRDFLFDRTTGEKREFAFRDANGDPLDWLLDPDFRKPFNDLTAQEFRQYHDAITSLIHNGVNDMKVVKQGEAMDKDILKQKLMDQLARMSFKRRGQGEGPKMGPIPSGPASVIRYVLAEHIQMEALLNRFDHGDTRGPWTQMVMRPLAKAANETAAIEKRYAGKIRALDDGVDLKEKMENNLFLDPHERDMGVSQPLPMTRGNFRTIMLNIGNPSNLKKLADGYQLHPQQILDYVNQFATKEDWKFAQGVWDIFKDMKREADNMYRRLTGVAPTDVEVVPLQTPHGEFDGGYYPLIYKFDYVGKDFRNRGADPFETQNYFRATPGHGYTFERTGYVGPLSLNLDEMPIRLRQMIHDVGMREAVLEAGKIFYDKDIRNAITRHYGKEFSDLFIPYIRDVAGVADYSPAADYAAGRVFEALRQNVIATLIGFNPGTVAKHGLTALAQSINEVGGLAFAKEFLTMAKMDDKTATTNFRFAMNKSTELQRRTRHYYETVTGATDETFGNMSWRQFMIKMGSTPVAWADLGSAIPTWLARYKQSIKEGLDEGRAIEEADYAVRRAHGSTAITNRAQISRRGGLWPWVTSLYNFFSHILNRQYEMGWRAKDVLSRTVSGDFEGVGKDAAKVARMFTYYVLIPAVVEEYVAGHGDPKEGWIHYAGRTIGHSLASSWIIARDVAHALDSNRDPSTGLISTTSQAVYNSLHDWPQGKILSKQHAGKTLRHTLTTAGMMTGYFNNFEAHAAEGLYNYATGLQKPRDWQQAWRLMRTGQTREMRH